MDGAYLVKWSGHFESSSTDFGTYTKPTTGTLLCVSGSIERAVEMFQNWSRWRGNQLCGCSIDSVTRIDCTSIAVDRNLMTDPSHDFVEAEARGSVWPDRAGEQA